MDTEKIKLLFLVYAYIHILTNIGNLSQNLFESLVLFLVIVLIVKCS